ncbi:hypothetical protein G3I51_24260 [Streptomyces sp. SID9944]|nr:hypothetical protein [Streptomyces sp. SID9944]
MSDIADFLRARYAEARSREEGVRRIVYPNPFTGHDVEVDSDGRVWIDRQEYPADRYWELASEPGADPAVIADLDAKLAIVDQHQDVNDGNCGTCVDGHWGYPTHGGSSPATYPCRTLRLLAQPFAGHPDHKGEEWAP